MKSFIFLLSLGLLLGLASPLARPMNVTAASINLVTPVAGEGDDFATRVLGMPWDMSTGPYPDFPTVFDNVDRASFSASSGIWSFTTLTNDPNIWLHFPNIQGTQHVLKLGDVYPINAAKYKLLSFRMCSSAADELNAYWYNAPLTPSPAFGVSYFINTMSGCKVYVIDLSQIQTFPGLAWSGNLMGFRLDPASLNSNLSMQLDWVRLTTADTSNIVPINWSGVNSGTTLYFYLSLDGTCGTTNAALVGTTPRSGSSGTFNWGNSLQPNPTAATPFPLPESFQPGQYTVAMLVDNAGPPVCASSTLEIHQAPLLTFQKPSYTSGPDYATQVVGDPWGMDSKQDVGSAVDIYNTSATNGIYNGTTDTTGDPKVYLHTTAPIDSSKYKYATYSFYLEGTQNIDAGWISRFFWWYQGISVDTVTLSDTVVYEGWHTYSIDLSKALIAPAAPQGSWSGFPTVFRFDPDEVPATMYFHLDFVTLTGDESVPAGTPFPIVYQATPASGVNVTLYYDTDADATNGRTLMAHYTSASATPGPFSLFLPTLTTNFPPDLNLLTGTTWMWDTTGVPPGTYHVSADVNDGVMTTTWYSELPVSVTP